MILTDPLSSPSSPPPPDDPSRVEIRSFAERILFGSTLDDKLYAPKFLSDLHSGRAIEVPKAPARTAALSLILNTPSKKKKKSLD